MRSFTPLHWLKKGIPLVLLAVGLTAVAVWNHWYRAWVVQEFEVERVADEAERRLVFVRGDFASIFDLCMEGWRDGFNIHHRPTGLAWTRTTLDGYFLEGSDPSSLRQLRCDASGVERGPRVERPWVDRLPAEDDSTLGSVTEDRWQLAWQRLEATRLKGTDLAVELLQSPLSGEVIWRRWRGLEGGAQAVLEPSSSPAFPGLIVKPVFLLAPGDAPPPLRPLPRFRWIDQPEAAFARIREVIPEGAGIVEITLGEDEIRLRIEWPTPAFDGDPSAPYGDLDLDDHGIAELSWWYPRTDPGFGCASGRPVAQVEAEFRWARGRVGPASSAWYSCSPAYSDGHRGAWHLYPRPSDAT